jgi:hypothetical protein
VLTPFCSIEQKRLKTKSALPKKEVPHK